MGTALAPLAMWLCAVTADPSLEIRSVEAEQGKVLAAHGSSGVLGPASLQ